MKKRKKWYIKIWKEGEYFDFWSFNHFFGGFVFAKFLIIIHISFWDGFFIALFYMLLWEVYEIARKVKETNVNRFLDIITGFAGFLLGYYLIISNKINDTTVLFIFIIFTSLQLWGYYAYRVKK